MTEQETKTLAEEYKADYIPMYQRVAEVAFIDGVQAAMEFMKNKLQEL